jgi:hypothetical protein
VRDEGIDVVVFDAVKVEPTLESFEAAVAAPGGGRRRAS